MIPEKQPNSVAAGIIYFVSQLCHLNITKHDIENVCNVSQVTINKCSNILQSLHHEFIPECIMKKYNIA